MTPKGLLLMHNFYCFLFIRVNLYVHRLFNILVIM